VRVSEFLLVDISNSFTKVALSSRTRLGRIHRLPTPSLSADAVRGALGEARWKTVVLSSVVPSKSREARRLAVAGELVEIGAGADPGLPIDYPEPSTIGADRLANAVACAGLYGCPAIVVDFGTAVTFDVISARGHYIGGVIAPGLDALTAYLHERTALLPRIALREPTAAVGRSTEEAMLSGAVHGYRGLIAEILRKIRKEAFGRRKPVIVATGGDGGVIARGLPVFDAVDPSLTMQGLRLIGAGNRPLPRGR